MKYLFQLKWLFIIGLFGFIVNNDMLKLFIAFILLFIIQGYLKYKNKLKEVPFYKQHLLQKYGQIYLSRKYKNKPINVDNYKVKNEYILPFEGEWFVEYGGNTKFSSHSWHLISQRYAYDFEIRDENNKIYQGDFFNLNSYYCYGQNILACHDGEIVRVKDGYDDAPMRIDRKGMCYCNEIRGNHIIIKHPNGEYSLVAHLLKGSINVKVGDKVKQGEIIARCGNSGNTDGPHIHFQISNGISFFFSASLPIFFKGIGRIEPRINVKNT